MQSAVYFAPGNVELVERPDPAPTDDNLVLDVLCCAICGTDVKLATIGHARCKAPRIIGHEFVGRIRHAGAAVKGFRVGERVTMATTLTCAKCAYCRMGLGNMCAECESVGLTYDGAFAARLAVPPAGVARGNVIKVPDTLADEAACLAEPISCAINSQEIAGVKKGDRVLVVGGGPLGAIEAEVAKANGASKVMIVQRSEPRLSLLRRLKDVIVIDGSQDVLKRVQAETDGLGADVAIVCAPERTPQEQAINYVRKGGVVSLFASLPQGASDLRLDSRVIHYRELRVVGSSDSRAEHVQKAVDLLAAGRIDATGIVTHRFGLSRFHEGIDVMKQKQGLKVVIIPEKR